MLPRALLLMIMSLASGAVAEPAAPASSPAPSSTPVPVKADWRARSMAWFGDVKDNKGRRKAMRQATRALKQPCRYCHTRDFKGYTDKRAISQQMMALSVEHGLECGDCHAGKTALTELGEASRPMWQLAHERKTFCEECHAPNTRLETLTDAGRTYEETLKKAKKTSP